MFAWFKKRKKGPNIDELQEQAKENDKDGKDEISFAYFRGTNMALDKEKSSYSMAETSETDKLDV